MSLSARLRDLLASGHAQDMHLLDGDGLHHERPADAVEAAVLVAITDRDRPGVILTQRPETMRKHAGQVAFPGGRMDPDDADLFAAALREAEEEVALPRDQVDLIGATDPYRTITGYKVTPIIGVVPPDLPLVANAEEVAAIFEAPLDFLLDPANHATNTLNFNGRTRTYYEIFWGDRRIWGATAAMIVNLSRRIAWHG
ncbi:MAG: CoA pyrophosphatase [Alphaproteobacteria bacterium]|nr:CoA pyrophosphatase [Alphaproteobacteria bacterium]